MDERSERIARRFEWPIIVAALLVIPVFVLEQSDVAEPWDTITAVANSAILARLGRVSFALLAVVPHKWR